MMINMLRFDESRLVSELEQVPIALRAAFAAACAERLMAAYRLFENRNGRKGPSILEQALDNVWTELDEDVNPEELAREIEELMTLIPQEDGWQGAWTQEVTNAQNAGMAVVYALRTRLTGSAQEAAWAARVAYEALDNFVINTEDIDTNRPGGELQVLSHALVQAELARQRTDLEEMRACSLSSQRAVIAQVRARAKTDSTRVFAP